MNEVQASGSVSARPRSVHREQAGSSGSVTSRPKRRLKNLFRKARSSILPPQEEEPYLSEAERKVRRKGFERLLFEGEGDKFKNSAYYQYEFLYAQKCMVRKEGQPPLDLKTWHTLLSKCNESCLMVRKYYRNRALIPLKKIARYFIFQEKTNQKTTREEMKQYAYAQAYCEAYYDLVVGRLAHYFALVAKKNRCVQEALDHYEEVKDQPWVTFNFDTEDNDEHDFDDRMPYNNEEDNENAINASRIQYPASFSSEICLTRVGTSSVNTIPTATQIYTRTYPIPTVIRLTATSTVTASPVTTISTLVSTSIYTTTATSKVDTVFSTTTPTTTATTISTVISTVTSATTTFVTTTLTASVTTISPTNYTPLASQISTLGYNYSRKRSLEKHSKHNGSLIAHAEKHAANKSKSKTSSSQYPHYVQCKKIVEEIVRKTVLLPASQTITVTVSPRAITSTSTSTLKTTTTVLLGASTTITSTAPISTFISTGITTGLPSTTTTIQTQTQTVIPPPLSTVFAACQGTDNIITKINQLSIINTSDHDSSGQVSFAFAGSASANACCNVCQSSALSNPKSCYYFLYDLSTSNCLVRSGNVSPQDYEIFIGTPDVVHTHYYQAGNGPGGHLVKINT